MRKQKFVLVDSDEFLDIADESDDALACLLTKESGAHVRYCLDTLKLAQRSVMELAFFEDMSYGDIAKVVDCPENTVKTRIFHAKQAMKNCLSRRLGGTA